jgi:hypothetical protein
LIIDSSIKTDSKKAQPNDDDAYDDDRKLNHCLRLRFLFFGSRREVKYCIADDAEILVGADSVLVLL